MASPFPNFLVIGGVRCGTTSLFGQLRQHPDIFLSPVKEPSFFLSRNLAPPHVPHEAVADLDAYASLFNGVNGEAAIGEVSPLYLYLASESVPRIRRYMPDARLAAILRDPVERAHSQYRMAVRTGAEPYGSFEEALRAEDRRVEQGEGPLFHYARQSLYTDPIRRFQRAFGAERLRVYLFEEFTSDPGEVLRDLFRFLEIDEDFNANTARLRNRTRPPRSTSLQALLTSNGPLKRLIKPLVLGPLRAPMKRRLLRANIPGRVVPPGIRHELIGRFREDVLELESLLGRDLRAWLR